MSSELKENECVCVWGAQFGTEKMVWWWAQAGEADILLPKQRLGYL